MISVAIDVALYVVSHKSLATWRIRYKKNTEIYRQGKTVADHEFQVSGAGIIYLGRDVMVLPSLHHHSKKLNVNTTVLLPCTGCPRFICALSIIQPTDIDKLPRLSLTEGLPINCDHLVFTYAFTFII
jgi:hypothetical protein